MAQDNIKAAVQIIDDFWLKKAAVQIIDDFLLKGELSIELVKASLDIIARSYQKHHLTLSNLENGLPEDAAKAIEALLRLRLLFEDEPDPSPELVKKLFGLRSLYQLVRGYLLQPTDPRQFETRYTKVQREYKCEELGLMARSLAYQLAMYDVSKTDLLEIQKARIVAACSELLGRLEQHWRSLLSSHA